MVILLFEQAGERRRSLEGIVKACLGANGEDIRFFGYEPRDVFQKKMPADAAAAFIRVHSMQDLEAARQFGRVYSGVPLVFISDTPDYAIESFAIGACHYLQEPLTTKDMRSAIERCGRSHDMMS